MTAVRGEGVSPSDRNPLHPDFPLKLDNTTRLRSSLPIDAQDIRARLLEQYPPKSRDEIRGGRPTNIFDHFITPDLASELVARSAARDGGHIGVDHPIYLLAQHIQSEGLIQVHPYLQLPTLLLRSQPDSFSAVSFDYPVVTADAQVQLLGKDTDVQFEWPQSKNVRINKLVKDSGKSDSISGDQWGNLNHYMNTLGDWTADAIRETLGEAFSPLIRDALRKEGFSLGVDSIPLFVHKFGSPETREDGSRRYFSSTELMFSNL